MNKIRFIVVIITLYDFIVVFMECARVFAHFAVACLMRCKCFDSGINRKRFRNIIDGQTEIGKHIQILIFAKTVFLSNWIIYLVLYRIATYLYSKVCNNGFLKLYCYFTLICMYVSVLYSHEYN